MEVFTLNRKFLQQDEIDVFHSMIWTERYYGDSDMELVVAATMDNIKKLKPGLFIGISGSHEVMILETMTIEEGKMKFVGMSLLPWLNNRFVRATAPHKDKSFAWPTAAVPGKIMGDIVYNWCCQGSQYLNGTIPIGIPTAQLQLLPIPGLTVKDYDKSGIAITPQVDYEPVYDALRKIAAPYRIGMQITLDSASDTSYSLGFRSYKGLDRTSSQTVNAPVRFSPQMDSLTNIKELQSIAALKTQVYEFASSYPDTAAFPTSPGIAVLSGSQYTGFDLRALQEFDDEATTDLGDAAALLALLNTEAAHTLNDSVVIKAVDGEIVPENQYQYGRDYYLGDIIEVQGNSDVIQRSRVTEYIRTQDEAGERSYPTIAALD